MIKTMNGEPATSTPFKPKETIDAIEKVLKDLLECHFDDRTVVCSNDVLSDEFKKKLDDPKDSQKCNGIVMNLKSEGNVRKTQQDNLEATRNEQRFQMCWTKKTYETYQTIADSSAWDAAQMSADLVKLIGEYKKSDEVIDKQLQTAAAQIKKMQLQVEEAKKAIDSIKTEVDGFGSSTVKKDLNTIEDPNLTEIVKLASELLEQANQAYLNSVKVAALNRLNDLTMLETLVIEVKQASESLKKNVEENSENASKKMVALLKEYATIVTAHASSIVAAHEADSDVGGALESFGFLNCNLLAKIEKDETFNEDATVQKKYDTAKDSFKDVAIKAVTEGARS